MAFHQIDWHDFVVVETIEVDDQEVAALPPPLTREQVLGMSMTERQRLALSNASAQVQTAPSAGSARGSMSAATANGRAAPASAAPAEDRP